MQSIEKDIFQKGSTTYYWSSKFFPRGVRDDVYKLYSFVRVVDDMVDQLHPEQDRFERIVQRWNTVKKQLRSGELPGALDDSVDERVLYNMAYICHRFAASKHGLEQMLGWVDAFLASMQMDLDQREYKTLDDTVEYIYGSAEVIGLFMVRILGLPGQGGGSDKLEPEVMRLARMQGRAMQYINFLRDIAEDNELGRQYIPKDALQKHGLPDLSKKSAQQYSDSFKKLMHEQLELYDQWQAEANKGMSYIPKRLRIPVQTAIDMYDWTAYQIRQNPMLVYGQKIKPNKTRVATTAIKRLAI